MVEINIVHMRKFLKNPWTIGIGSSIIVILLGKVAGWIFQVKLWKIVGIAIKQLFAWFIDAQIKLWIPVLAVLVIIFLFIWQISKIKKSTKKSLDESEQKPDYLDYVEDIFYSAKWKWKWAQWPNSRKYHPDKLHMVCTKCGVAIKTDRIFNTSRCINPDCESYNKSYYLKPDDMDLNNIRKMIRARIKSGKYKELIE